MNTLRMSCSFLGLGALLALSASGCGDLFDTPNSAKAALHAHSDGGSSPDGGETPAPPPGMVLIPGGKFLMGCVPGDPSCTPGEQPQHAVQLAAYYLDAHEVTIARYAACVKDGVCMEPTTSTTSAANCNWGIVGRDEHPVNCLTWAQADAFCLWDAKALPTEAQWEKAARGGVDGKKYPWTLDKIDCSLVVWNGGAATSGKGCDHGGTLPAGSRPGNGYGLYDMAGNVWEWVADWYGDDYYAASPAAGPTGPTFGSNRAARGGGFADGEARNFRASARNSLYPTDGAADLGFRCARAVP